MTDPSLFATERYPLHCSQIPDLMACPWKQVMKFVEQAPRTSGVAADTGSACHRAMSHWHKNGKEDHEAIAAMRAAREEYPMADLIEAERLFQAYTKDPRNIEAKVVASEYHLEGTLRTEEGEAFYFEGTVDQIREEDVWRVWDAKTSKSAGPLIRDEFTYQVVAYAALAQKAFKRVVLPGGIILPRDYDTKPEKVFYPYDITEEGVKALMRCVIHRVQEVRAGRIAPVPGEVCKWCVGTRACLEKLIRFQKKGRL
jgi:PD-(D/E)XK nuclease superfamily